jgi:hypothetical protein
MSLKEDLERIMQPGFGKPPSTQGEPMQCEYGGEVTFTACEPGYRLRLSNGSTVSVILSPADVQQLQARIRKLVADADEEEALTAREKLPGAP